MAIDKKKVTIGFTGKGYSEFVPPGCDPERVSLIATFEENGQNRYLWMPLPAIAFEDAKLMAGLKSWLRKKVCLQRSIIKSAIKSRDTLPP